MRKQWEKVTPEVHAFQLPAQLLDNVDEVEGQMHANLKNIKLNLLESVAFGNSLLGYCTKPTAFATQRGLYKFKKQCFGAATVHKDSNAQNTFSLRASN
jgi:hypothetical protein